MCLHTSGILTPCTSHPVPANGEVHIEGDKITCHFSVLCCKTEMAPAWLSRDDGLGARDLHHLQAWLRCSVISQLEVEGHTQLLGERCHFPSLERVNRHIQKWGRINSQREQKAEINQLKALVCTYSWRRAWCLQKSGGSCTLQTLRQDLWSREVSTELRNNQVFERTFALEQ